MPEKLHLERVKKQIPALQFDVSGEAATDIAGTGYTVIQNAANVMQFLYHGTIDIQGWTTLRDNTFYPQLSIVQRASNYLLPSATGGGDYMTDYVFVMPRELTDDEITALGQLRIPAFISGTIAGLYGANGVDLQHVLFGQWNFVCTNSTTAPLCQIIDSDKFGSGEPTLANRLHVYRFCSTNVTNATAAAFPPMNLFIEGAFGVEPKLEYMERLRRTFVLASDLE